LDTPRGRTKYQDGAEEFADPAVESAYRAHVEQATARSLVVAVARYGRFLLLAFGLLTNGAGLAGRFMHSDGQRGMLSAVMLMLLAWRSAFSRPALATEGLLRSQRLEVLGFVLFFLIYHHPPG